jgi:hypothetical protein
MRTSWPNRCLIVRSAAESGVPAGSAVVYLYGGPRDEDQLMSDLLERLITGIAAALQTI